MMFAVILALSQGSTGSIEALPAVIGGAVTVEALVRLPKTTPMDRAALEVLREAILADTNDYARSQLLDMTAATGDPIRCDVYPDCFRVRFSVSDVDKSLVVSVLENVLNGSELKEPDLKAAVDGLAFRHRGYWESALDPAAPEFRRLRLEDVVDDYKAWFRPDNIVVTFAAAGNVASDLADRWRESIAKWDLSPVRLYPDRSLGKPIANRPGTLTTIVLRGHPIDPAGVAFPSQLLAVVGMGAGKSSAVWRALREGFGWSYRQEALLRNSQEGLEPDIVAVTERSDHDTARALEVRPAVAAVVAKWTEDDRNRAIENARTLFGRSVGFDPLYFMSTRPTTDALFLKTYWRMKTGNDWDDVAMLRRLENVSLEAMRLAAQQILDGAGVEVIRGRD